MSLEGNPKTHAPSSYEIDAVTAVLIDHLHLERKRELKGAKEQGYIIVPVKTDWRLFA